MKTVSKINALNCMWGKKNRLSYYCLLGFFCLIQKVTAQTEKGDMIAGGTLDMSYQIQDTVKTFGLSINPGCGYFIVKNFLLGVNLGIGLSSDNKTKDRSSRIFLNTSFVPFMRYYLGKGKTRYFAQLRGGYLGATSIVGTGVANLDGWLASGSLGLVHFIHKNIALESQLSYIATHYEKQKTTHRFGINLGIQVYFHPIIKENQRPIF